MIHICGTLEIRNSVRKFDRIELAFVSAESNLKNLKKNQKKLKLRYRSADLFSHF
jgi:hypothetical protein